MPLFIPNFPKVIQSHLIVQYQNSLMIIWAHVRTSDGPWCSRLSLAKQIMEQETITKLSATKTSPGKTTSIQTNKFSSVLSFVLIFLVPNHIAYRKKAYRNCKINPESSLTLDKYSVELFELKFVNIFR